MKAPISLLTVLAIVLSCGALDAGEIAYVNHVVKAGETLSGLAKKYYGDEYRWPRIHECNRWIDPNQLTVGQTICIPEPTQGMSSGGGITGFMDLFRPGNGALAAPAGPAPTARPGGTKTSRTNNPGTPAAGGSWKEMIKEILQLECFGRPLGQVLLFVLGWFIAHTMIQGAFTWFAAHMAFAKDVSFKKAWQATVQSETLAACFMGIVGVAGLAVIYVATAPPGKPVLSELLMIAEQYLSTSEGMAIGGVGMVGLYVFLGVRFIPRTFQTSGSQGFAIVFLSVLVPHAVLVYLVGYRLGYL